MQAADRRVRVPGALGAVLLEHPRQAVGIFGEVLERHRAVFDERHRLAVAFHRHHDVEPRLAHFPDVALQCVIGDLDHAARQPNIAHQLHQLPEFGDLLVLVVAGKLDQQDRVRITLEKAIDRGLECRVTARKFEHGAVDQFDRNGLQLDDVLRRFHRAEKGREVAHAERLVPRQRREIEMDALRIRQRAFGTDQQMRHVVAGAAQHVEVVAADTPQQLGKAVLDLIGFARGDSTDSSYQIEIAPGRIELAEIGRHRAELELAAVGQHGVNRTHVVHHVAVAYRARAAAVVAGHAAERRLRAGRNVDRIPQPVRPEPGIETIEHHAGLHAYRARVPIEGDHLIQIFAMVDHQRVANGLAALRRATPARQYRDTLFQRNLQRDLCVALGFWDHHTDRLELVDRRVGRIAAARVGVEQHIAFDFALELGREPAVTGARMQFDHCRCGRGHGLRPPPQACACRYSATGRPRRKSRL